MTAVKDEERRSGSDRREGEESNHDADSFAPMISDRVALALRGVRLILLYLAILGTVAFVLTLVTKGGPF